MILAQNNSDIPPLDRLRADFADVLEFACTPEEARDFRGEASMHASSAGVVSSVLASPHRLHPARGIEGVDFAALALVRAGAAVLEGAGPPQRLRPGDIAVLDPSRDFELRFYEPAQLVLYWSRPLQEAARHADRTLSGAEPLGEMLGASIALFAQIAPRANGSEFDALARNITDLAVRSLEHHRELATPTALDLELETFTAMRRFIDRNLASPKLDVAMIARAIGLSRASVYRLTASLGGVASYIREARLERARHLLATARFADRRIAETAHLAGFRSVGAFNRLFLARYGLAPRAVRSEALARARALDVRQFAGNGDGELIACLRALEG